jgi:hypothetical protein
MALSVCWWRATSILAFQATSLPSSFSKRIPFQQASSTALNAEASKPNDPQVFALGYSPKLDLFEAIQEATEIALQALPKATQEDSVEIDFGMITVSSLYDGQS